jgi:hypothetical protein
MLCGVGTPPAVDVPALESTLDDATVVVAVDVVVVEGAGADIVEVLVAVSCEVVVVAVAMLMLLVSCDAVFVVMVVVSCSAAAVESVETVVAVEDVAAWLQVLPFGSTFLHFRGKLLVVGTGSSG